MYIHIISQDDGTAMELYYIWVDDTRIMPVSLLVYKVIDSAHVYMDAKKQFQEGRITEDAFCKYQFTGMGRLEKVSEYERLDELQQYLEEEADTKGKNIQILPYTMQIMAKDFINICGFMVFVLFCVICIVVCIIRTSTSCGEKMLVEYRKGQGDTAALRQKLANFFRQRKWFFSYGLIGNILPGYIIQRLYFKKQRI